MLGSASAIEYFRNHASTDRPEGYLILAPFSSAPCPPGYSREFADSLSAVDRLQFILLAQERAQWEQEQIFDDAMTRSRQQRVVDNLKERMISSSTSPHERDFISFYLLLREEKREKHRKVFEQRTAYLNVLAHETPKGRMPNEERVNLDRLELPK